jgi:hypothetical protein
LYKSRNEETIPPPRPEEPTFDLREALTLSLCLENDKRRPELEKIKQMGAEEQETAEDNVQQLIRETDEAFKSVGESITARSPLGKTFFSSKNTTPEQSPRSSGSLKGRSPRQQQKSAASPSKHNKPAPLAKATRRGSQKKKNTKARAAKAQAAKWTENAKELINTRLFNRIEVDEVLSPTQLEEIRMSRATKKSLEINDTEECDSPVEPFYLEDLPSRIGAAGVGSSVTPPPEEERPTTPGFDFDFQPVRKDFSVKKETDGLSYREMSFPTPPLKSPARMIVRKQLPPLPTIPEVMVTGPDNSVLTPSSDPNIPKEDAFLFLPCQPRTKTAPVFRHGPIRLAKADLALAYSSSKLAAAAADKSLDWTAFQMAILGGAGDFFSEAVDYSRPSASDMDEADELWQWFEELGLDSTGELVDSAKDEEDDKDDAAPLSPTDSNTSSSSRGDSSTSNAASAYSPVSSSGGDNMLPIEVGSEHPNGFWNEGDFDASRFYQAKSVGLKRWAGEGHPKRYERSPSLSGSTASGRRPSTGSVHSLPQSPMLDLVVSRDADGNEYVVPMGYNLGHDLGDFLRWETENVHAAGFYEI